MRAQGPKPRGPGRPKGTPKTGGRKKGTPNKFTASVRDLVLTALAEAGGIDYLVEQAKANPPAFLSLVGKIMPLQMTGPAGGPIQTRVVFGGRYRPTNGASDR